MRVFRLLIKYTCLICVVALAAQFLHYGERARLESQIVRLEEEKVELESFVERLCASQRVAQVTVTKQYVDADGQTVNELQWREQTTNGTLSEPQVITALGEQVYFEGLVLKFEQERLRASDPPKGSSMVLFRRVFGDQQAPASVSEFERHQALHQAGSASAEDEGTALWRHFWDLVDDPALRQRHGVRVAQCEAPAVRLQEGQIWQLDLAAAGGLNLHKAADGSQFAQTTP